MDRQKVREACEKIRELSGDVADTLAGSHGPGDAFTYRGSLLHELLDAALVVKKAWNDVSEGWVRVSDRRPGAHAKFEVRRPGLGTFVATPCYGMHNPWWVPLVADKFAPGSIAFGMEAGDEWRPWTEDS